MTSASVGAPAPSWRPVTVTAWTGTGRRVLRWSGTLALGLFVAVAALGSPASRHALEAPDPTRPVFADDARTTIASGLAPAWWPGFDRGPFFEPLPAVHLLSPPRVSVPGRVLQPIAPERREVEVSERYLRPGGDDAVAIRSLRTGEVVDVEFVIVNRSRETLRGVTIVDPVLGRFEVDGPIEPGRDARARGAELIIPPRVASEELPALLLGTDPLGRDLAARLAAGAWRSLSVAAGAALVAAVGGGSAGWVAARRGRPVVAALGRAELVLLTFPFLLVAVVVVLVSGATVPVLAGLVGAVSVPATAVQVRAAVATWRRSPDVLVARAGAARSGDRRAPSEVPTVVRGAVGAALTVAAAAVATESALAFIGLEPQPPAVSLGAMVADVRHVVDSSPGYLLLPGVLLTLASFGLLSVSGMLRRRPDASDRELTAR